MQRGGVFDVAQNDALETGPGAGPVRVRLQHDLGAAVVAGDLVWAVVQAGVERRTIVARGVDVVARVGCLGEDGGFDVFREDLVPLGEILPDPVEVQHGGPVVHDVDAGGAIPGIGIGKAAVGIAAELPGEGDVACGDGLPVGPGEARLEPDGDRHARLAVRPDLPPGQPIVQRRQVGAEQAGVFPLGVERRDRTDHERHRVGANDLRVDVGMQAGGPMVSVSCWAWVRAWAVPVRAIAMRAARAVRRVIQSPSVPVAPMRRERIPRRQREALMVARGNAEHTS